MTRPRANHYLIDRIEYLPEPERVDWDRICITLYFVLISVLSCAFYVWALS